MTREDITHERVTKLLLDVMEFTYNSDSLSEAEKKALDDIRAALAEPDAKREPATHEQVFAAYGATVCLFWLDYRAGWRAAERFHGIRKEDT
jgi:hypothetical protein